MVNALILNTNGTYEVKRITSLEDYQSAVAGNIEILPFSRNYINPNDKKKKQKQEKKQRQLLCYVNGDGMNLGLTPNPYAGVLSILGASLHMGIFLYGNVIIMSEVDGVEKDIDPYIVSVMQDYKQCEDEDTFYIELERLVRPPRIKAIQEAVPTEESSRLKRKETTEIDGDSSKKRSLC